jgi:chitin synthase
MQPQTQQPQPIAISDLSQEPRDLSSSEIAEILKQRFLNDLNYTTISPSVLLVLNPHDRDDETESNVQSEYITEYKDTTSAKANQWQPPHLYQFVNNAYLHMRRTNINQSILFR